MSWGLRAPGPGAEVCGDPLVRNCAGAVHYVCSSRCNDPGRRAPDIRVASGKRMTKIGEGALHGNFKSIWGPAGWSAVEISHETWRLPDAKQGRTFQLSFVMGNQNKQESAQPCITIMTRLPSFFLLDTMLASNRMFSAVPRASKNSRDAYYSIQSNQIMAACIACRLAGPCKQESLRCTGRLKQRGH